MRLLTDTTFGEFEWILDHWLSVEPVDGLSLSVEGTRDEFNPTALMQASTLVEAKEKISSEAIYYLSNENIDHFARIELLTMSCLASSSVAGCFDVQFEVAGWEDACVIVHFKDDKPESLSLGD